MNTGPKKRPLHLTDKQRDVLTGIVRRRLAPQQVAKRARILFESEQGFSNLQISSEFR
ncbi:hypothetical protein [Paenibacillus hemerocallicola]|uniref:hypothetical protein n=1 Tax=Paenibacillus hemerocallicola TaxID=1172614 RepID=UPI00159EE02A|nr:hypothetical protein [Paenibacillus hemerocallicola]